MEKALVTCCLCYEILLRTSLAKYICKQNTKRQTVTLIHEENSKRTISNYVNFIVIEGYQNYNKL
jgi:hypothetical protein